MSNKNDVSRSNNVRNNNNNNTNNASNNNAKSSSSNVVNERKDEDESKLNAYDEVLKNVTLLSNKNFREQFINYCDKNGKLTPKTRMDILNVINRMLSDGYIFDKIGKWLQNEIPIILTFYGNKNELIDVVHKLVVEN